MGRAWCDERRGRYDRGYYMSFGEKARGGHRGGSDRIYHGSGTDKYAPSSWGRRGDSRDRHGRCWEGVRRDGRLGDHHPGYYSDWGRDRREERRSRSRRRWSDKGRQAPRSIREEPRRDQRDYLPHAGQGRRRDGRGGRDGRRSKSRRSPTRSSSSEYSSSAASRGPSASPPKKKKDGSGDSDKDETVHFDWRKGMVMNSRYHVVRLLGDGTFGRVLLANDQRDGRQVAVKVIRDVKRYGENAKIEADILKDIGKSDPQGTLSRSAMMYDTFQYERHFCLVFEPCGVSLYDFLKKNSYRGFLLQDIQTFARESLEAMDFLHGKMKMTHTDLKPENILLETREPARPCDFPREALWREERRRSSSPSSSRVSEYLRPASAHIRIIDFGNATYENEHHSSTINTRQYRSPEVILGLGWNELSDIWSLGCIFMELYTGELLFGTHENLEHLALMEKVVEPLRESVLASAKKEAKDKYVVQEPRGQMRLNWPERAQSSSSEKRVMTQRRLGSLVAPGHDLYANFCVDLLTPEPAKRPSAREALQHQFLSKHIPE